MAKIKAAVAALPSKERNRLTAVVLDANAAGRGRPVLDDLTAWAELLAANGLELWIPEPVLLEWAEHVATDYEYASRAASQERRALRNAGLEVPEWSLDRDDVVEHVRTEVAAIPGLTVIPLDPSDARQAVIDQLLQRPPATRKRTVKTGAGDSAWLRAVYRNAGRKFRRVVIVTGDTAAVDGMVRTLGTEPPYVVPRFDDVRTLLALTRPTTDAETWTLVAELKRQVSLPREERVLDAAGFAAGDASRAASGRPDGLADVVYDATLVDVYDVVGVRDVRHPVDGRAFTADVYALGTVAVSTAGHDDDGSAVYDEEELAGFLVSARLLLRLDDEGRLAEVRNEDGIADVQPADETTGSPRSGLFLLDQALATVPGLDPPALPPGEDTEWTATPNGHRVTIRIEHDGPGWSATADVDGTTAAVLHCVRAGGANVFDDDYRLDVEPVDWPNDNPPWTFAARILDAVAG